MINNNEHFIQGKAHGLRAFADGKTRVPAHDSNFLDTLVGRHMGDDRTTEYLTGWLQGWDLANLAAPV